jgi:endonuclease YncB( thermonuclease family)
MVVGTAVVPVTNVQAASVPSSASAGVSSAVGAKTTMAKEKAKAKAAVKSAASSLKGKEKSLKAAVKSQAKAQKAFDKANVKAADLQVRAVAGPTKKAKAKAAAAARALTAAQKKLDRANALVASRTATRDVALAKYTRLAAKYAWLTSDLSALECGAGTQVTLPNGAVETVNECGIVYEIIDGDTVLVKTTKNEVVEVRNIGIQTPELAKSSGTQPAQCGAKEASASMKELLPVETSVVQLRSMTASENAFRGMRRPNRSIYKLNNATGAFDIDVQAEQARRGWSIWWTIFEEWGHSAEYLELINGARAASLGVWNPNLCGASGGAVPDLYMSASAPAIDGNSEPVFGEYAILRNPSGSPMDISGWSLRNKTLNFFWDASTERWHQNDNKFPAGTVIPAGGQLTVYLDNPSGYGLNTYEREYFTWGFGSGGAQLANSYVSGARINGDGLHLLDPNGNIRASYVNVCGSVAGGWTECAKPEWVTSLQTANSSQIIPLPVALNKVANSTRDTYNPVVTIASGATTSTLRTALSARYTVSAGVGDAIDSAIAAGTPIGVSTSANGANLVGSRIAIADDLGTTRTTVWIREASGQNTLPDLDGMTEAAARAAITAAGFVVGTVATESGVAVGTVKVDSQSVAHGRSTIGQTVNFTVYIP